MDTEEEEEEEALGLEFVKVTEVDRVLGFCERKRKREEMGFLGVEIGESGRMCVDERVAIDEFFFTVVSVCFSRAVRKLRWVMMKGGYYCLYVRQYDGNATVKGSLPLNPPIMSNVCSSHLFDF